VRVAVFIKSTTFHENHGGLETQNKALCEGLVGRGHSIVVFSPQRELYIKEKTENGVLYKFVGCKFKMGVILGFFGHLDKNNWVNRSYAVFKEAYDEDKFDLVLGQSSAAIGVIRRKRELGVPVVSIAHGTILSEYRTFLGEIRSFGQLVKLFRNTGYVLKNFFGRQREFVHGSNKVIAVSNYVKRALLDETFVQEDKVVVVHNALDEKNFEQVAHIGKASCASTVNIIYVGRIMRSKGLFDLVEVLTDPKFSNSRLYLVGDGVSKKALEAKIANLGIVDRVVFCGWLGSDEVVDKLLESDIFVLPSLRIEGLPMTVIEAMFAGLPVVASDIGGISDAVVNGETGFLVTPGDKKALCAKLLALVETKELRNSFGTNAKIKAQKSFSLGVMLDAYERVFCDVL
jgi:glycosyltransferase involved in cell wall biosynthesis